MSSNSSSYLKHTAQGQSSIWNDLPEATFRRAVVQLEQLTNAVPMGPQIFPAPEQTNDHITGAQNPIRLSLEEEQRLADDISFISAVGEGAQSVAAATVQENLHPEPTDDGPSLRITVASVDAVESVSRDFLRQVFRSLALVDSRSEASVADQIFGLIARHHRQRLLNRLRSSRWVKPPYLARTHKKPLYADFAALVQRVPLMFTRRERAQRSVVEARLASLAKVLQDFENPPKNDGDEAEEDLRRQSLIMACYDLCIDPEISEYFRRLQSMRPTAQIQACMKALQQTEKIAAYRRIPLTLARLSFQHPGLFKSAAICFLAPYDKGPLEVAYQPWASATHVHAEVNLAVHHDLAPKTDSWSRPRCVGASKYLCYLCYLFLRHHGSYHPRATHGACYDQWTIPDLAEYPEPLRDHYREVLKGMYSDIVAASKDAVRRPEPMTSRENLLGGLDVGMEQ